MVVRQSPLPEEFFVKIQLGVRMNRRIVKVLKATAEYMDMPFSGLLENIAVANFQGHCAFGPDVLKQVARFSEIYGLDEMLEALDDAVGEFEKSSKEQAPERSRRK